MIQIRPFQGIRYNQGKIIDPSQVVCPPYDVINDEQQQFYYRQSPYNFIRLILNKIEPHDSEEDNRYKRSALLFEEWLKIGVLQPDAGNSFYFYKQDFFCNGNEQSRLGFIGLMQLQEPGVVLPHENTHQAPKADRYELLKAVGANLSPIFTVFSDTKNIIDTVFRITLADTKPDVLLKDTEGVRHALWRVSDPEVIGRISQSMNEGRIFIADGHHRYEVASQYQAYMKAHDAQYSPEKSYNYIMTYFTALESAGLSILPIHRVVTVPISFEGLLNDFKIYSYKTALELEDALQSISRKACVFGVYHADSIRMFELKDKNKLTDAQIRNKCFRDIDVAILDYYVLGQLLKIGKSAILYTKESKEAMDMVDAGKAHAAFIVRPTTVQQIQKVALCGERMPAKSTYFYPKVLSGLVLYKF